MIYLKQIKDKIASFPDAPGVYVMKDALGKIIYIGKAKSLKKRLQSYLSMGLTLKNMALMDKVVDIEYRLTNTESLALFLEAGLIREHKPKYNVALRDDKSFPLVKITNEEFPAVFITRKKQKDGNFFGPYTSVNLLKNALKAIRSYFPFRSCKKLPRLVCMYYRIGLCPGPCIGKITQRDYATIIKDLFLLLEGKTEALIQKLGRELNLKSKNLEFEAAAKIRDQINAISALGEKRNSPGINSEVLDLKRLLGLKILPLRIEAFDISNISGKEAVGSMVSFYDGIADKNNYRRFRIKTVNDIDDYAMLKEVLLRRYSRMLKDNFEPPDLILIDGGKAHLSCAQKVLSDLGISISLVSIAKQKENIYTIGRLKAIKLTQDTPALNLIRRIRDEAHRFAVAYHHVLRRKKIIGK